MKLVVVRHLPTSWNLEFRMQGQQDNPILPPDAETLAQIARTRVAVEASGPYDRVYCSRMRRTSQTAMLFGFPEPIPEALLDELNFGQFEGARQTEMLLALGPAWKECPQTLTLGESIVHLGERIQRFLAQITSCSRVLVFGHGAWTRALSSLLQTGGLEEMNTLSIGNGEALFFEIQPTP